MVTPYSIYMVLIILALMCAVVTWRSRFQLLRDPSNAWVPTTIFVNVAAENAYYFYARLIDDGLRSEVMWFLPGVLAFKLIYIIFIAKLVLDRAHDACE